MICNKKLCTEVLNYFPCLLILIFSMAALSMTLQVMDDHRVMTGLYTQTSQQILELESSYNKFEDRFWHYYEGDPSVSEQEVRETLGNFTDLFYETSQNKQGVGDVNVRFQSSFQKIERGLLRDVDLIERLKDLREEGVSRAEIAGEIGEVHEEIEAMWGDLYDKEQIEAFLEKIHQRESWLYWSVIAIGLSGFILIILNTDKLRKLKAADKEKQENLKLLSERLAAMENAFDGIGIVDKDNKIVYANKALLKMHGISLEERENYIGSNWRDLYGHIESLIDGEVLPQLYLKGYWLGESTVKSLSGELLPAEFSVTALQEGGFIVTIHDISDRAQAEKEKEVLESQFYQAQKMEAVGRLAGGIAHDFNNILAAMLGYAEFLTDDLDKSTPQHKFATNILKAGKQARSLVDQILTFSRTQVSATQKIDLVDAVQETLTMISATFPKTIEIQSNIDLKEAPIRGNATQISQILMNLCVNARDAMKEDKGTLSIDLDEIEPVFYENLGMLEAELPNIKGVPLARIEDLSAGHTRFSMNTIKEDKPYIRLRVSDTGSGMSRYIMERIFEPFFTTKSVEEGTGLGLATVHGVVIAHQAALVITSCLNKGTTFEILFPLSQEEEETKEAENKDAISVEGVRVFLVEDQEEIQKMMSTMLTRLGVKADFASDGLEALSILRERPGDFDLVITDQNMPKMTGLDLINQIHPEQPDLPFILLSGYSEEKLKQIMYDHPAIKDILHKPVSKGRLQESISQVILEKEKKS